MKDKEKTYSDSCLDAGITERKTEGEPQVAETVQGESGGRRGRGRKRAMRGCGVTAGWTSKEPLARASLQQEREGWKQQALQGEERERSQSHERSLWVRTETRSQDLAVRGPW